MDWINTTCAEIQTPMGFVYLILPIIMNKTNTPGCEQSWLLEDGLKIADPSAPQTLIDPVTAVKPDRLVTSSCVTLIHEIICDSADRPHYDHKTMFRVRNETAATPDSDLLNEVTPDLQHSDQFWWILAVFIIVLFIILLIILWKRNKILRCFQRFIYQRDKDDSKNKDPEAVVQMI